MRFLRRRQSAARFSACIFATFFLSGLVAFGQTPSNQTRPPTSIAPTQQSVDVVEHLSPEEVEDWKLNDLYESVAKIQRQGACTTDLIQRYKSEVIPAAEKAQFNKPKSKLLFLANRDLGNCYLVQNKFPEAEACFQKALEYAAVWPGIDDSAYPINFRQLATAQVGQQHWTDAEQSVLKSISIFDTQIAAWEKKANAEFMTLNYRGSQSRSYALLAVVYFREGRVQDALTTVEKAYDEVIKHNLAPDFLNEVLSIGKAIADASGESTAQKVWSQRNPD